MPRNARAQPVQRRGRGHEERAEVTAAPGKVGRTFGQADHPEAFGVRAEDMDPTGARAIDVALAVGFHAIGNTDALPDQCGPYPAVFDFPIARHVEDADVPADR